ncbi:MAG: AMP-binding protein [Gordonia sp. (in: high G+C Gram-positive bacteria)]|uniref:class I adenylate-forming enzyme family protein n=1 Tax=Gordonia sp. (in: high G+C Gram-positive bacteria) TaxID=84139 RepID=UPI0039E64F21
MTTGTYFAWDLASRGDTPCVRDDALELSYAQFAERVDAVAEQLRALGVGEGDVVATFLPNRVELLITLMAAWRLRAVGTPVNPGFTDHEAEYQLGDSGAKVVVGAAPIGDREARAFLNVDDLAEAPSNDWTAPEVPTEADDALLIYTSGSTGRPKGVRLGHDNLRFFASSAGEYFQHGPDSHGLLILPLFHVNAICVTVLTTLAAGGQVSITGHFSVRRFFDDVARLRPTFFSAVPTIYAMLVSKGDVPAGSLDSLKFAICGAAPISKELLDKTEQTFGIPIVEGYGLTEATCASCCNPIDGPRKLGTVGPALPGQTVAIVDPDGVPVPTGERGEVVISGPAVMRGYLNRPEATAETIVDGWLHTGDVGILDEDGYLRIVDRIKDMIIRGGENIYPKEIETALAGHEAVLECAVVGAPDPVFGEVPVAFVVAYPDATVDAEQLAAFIEPLLTKVKRPTEINLVDALPRNPVGKIDKPGLRRSLSDPA